MIRQLNEAQMELKIRYEQASKLAIDCAKLQLEYLKLYKPQLLQILEELQDISASVDADSVDPPNDGDGIESRDNQFNVGEKKWTYFQKVVQTNPKHNDKSR
ncbi:hypothetical protein G5I_09971 [Acromyrmex echinatior]|uniref:Uncharacterized protein n=1 Tax=Acromyrmex echinatior TaxID=103372 RepID=F4WVM5_ACREC|nr:hypothetical protein G5I_09971 [Acromyrmex echinatior]